MAGNLPIRGFGIAWYKREDYGRILEVMEDAHVLPPTHEKWLYLAQKAEAQAKKAGHLVVRAYIDPDEFVSWCARNDLKVDAKARTRWGNETVYAQVKNTH